jgi:DNA-binding response OmpR family regulator
METARCPTVLLIDDDPDILKLMEYVFADEDYRLVTCRTPDEGFQVLSNGDVDCVLLDIHFARTPECLGLLGAVRALPGCDRLPVFATSTMHEPEVATRVLDLGARKFIPKPFYPAEILQELHALFH